MRVELDSLAVEALDRLERELPSLGMKCSRADIVNALVFGATAPQALGCIQDFNRTSYYAERERSDGGPE